VNLSSSDPNIASVPASVTVPQNSTTAPVTVTPGNLGSATISASAFGIIPGSAPVNVVAPVISLTLDSDIVGQTRTINGTITLSAPAPPSGVTVNVAANPGGIVNVPDTVMVLAGNTTATCPITGIAEGSTLIRASSPGYNTGAANIKVGKLGQIVLPTNVVIGTNQSVDYPVTLITPAPAGGVTVTLTTSDFTKVTINNSNTV